ncbi:hypothetical protein KQX54_010804 [Cotesia glomerata]|uniref:Uncharacterized protein n=1 Tax=Cotesia glomerata TaxID=32391 RepID=A0AAV7J707_COTGL|nr:hypothetical protein KQX54_010804 [Cotesia glomerata]
MNISNHGEQNRTKERETDTWTWMPLTTVSWELYFSSIVTYVEHVLVRRFALFEYGRARMYSIEEEKDEKYKKRKGRGKYRGWGGGVESRAVASNKRVSKPLSNRCRGARSPRWLLRTLMSLLPYPPASLASPIRLIPPASPADTTSSTELKNEPTFRFVDDTTKRP